MMKACRSIKVHVQQRIDAALRGQQAFGLVLLSFVVILREGVETALFVFGAGRLTSPFEAIIGVAGGRLVAGSRGVGLSGVAWGISLGWFFQVERGVLRLSD